MFYHFYSVIFRYFNWIISDLAYFFVFFRFRDYLIYFPVKRLGVMVHIRGSVSIFVFFFLFDVFYLVVSGWFKILYLFHIENCGFIIYLRLFSLFQLFMQVINYWPGLGFCIPMIWSKRWVLYGPFIGFRPLLII